MIKDGSLEGIRELQNYLVIRQEKYIVLNGLNIEKWFRGNLKKIIRIDKKKSNLGFDERWYVGIVIVYLMFFRK